MALRPQGSADRGKAKETARAGFSLMPLNATCGPLVSSLPPKPLFAHLYVVIVFFHSIVDEPLD